MELELERQKMIQDLAKLYIENGSKQEPMEAFGIKLLTITNDEIKKAAILIINSESSPVIKSQDTTKNLEKQKNSERKCNMCSVSSLKCFYKDKVNIGFFICRSCYNKKKRKLKKEKAKESICDELGNMIDIYYDKDPISIWGIGPM
jgi:hypothetical protein